MLHGKMPEGTSVGKDLEDRRTNDVRGNDVCVWGANIVLRMAARSRCMEII